MAEQNPIKYTDLFAEDVNTGLQATIVELENLNKAYTGMATTMRQQAAALSESLKMVSGATGDGQKRTREAASEADKLEKAYRQLDFAMSDNARRLAELKAITKEQNTLTKLQVMENNAAEGSYNKLSAQYSILKIRLNEMSEAERKNTKEGQDMEKQAKKIYDEMNRLQQATGKYALNVGNYSNAITNAIGINTRWYKGLQEIAALTEGGLANGIKAAGSALGAFGKQLLALLANPIVAILAAVSAAFYGLAEGITSCEENTNKFNVVLAPTKRILIELQDLLQTCAEKTLALVERWQNLALITSHLLEKLPLLGSAFEKVNRAMEENIQLELQRQQIKQQERYNTVENAKLEYEVSLMKNIAASTNDATVKEMALKTARRKEGEILANNHKLALQKLDAINKEVAQNKSNTELLDKQAQAQAEVYRTQKAYQDHTLRINKQLHNLQKTTGGGGGRGGAGGNSVDLAKQMLEEQRQIEEARISLVEDSFERERRTIIFNYKKKIEDLKGSEEYITEMTLLLEQQREQKLADLFEREAKAQRDNEANDLQKRLKATDDMIKKRQEAVRKGEEAINQEYELSMSYIDLEDSEQKKTEMRLQAEKERLQALLKLYEQDGRTLTEAELQILKNNIAQVDKEMEKAKKGRDIYDMLGLNLSDEKKEAISESFSFALDQLSEYMNAWVQAAEKKAQLAEQDVERTKSNLDKEIEARNNGYASNVQLARKELDEAKKNQQKALQEQQRAQKAQQALQAVQQVSNLVTASSLIWSQLGFPWAIPALAVMWGSFAAAKLKAAELTSNTEEYGEGTVELLEGGSHQSGNDIDLGRKKDGTRRRAEGGEYFAVINKRNSRRFRDIIPNVINSLNDGTFAQKYQQAYGDGGMSVAVQQTTDIRELSNDVRIIREQGETSSTFDANGNEIVRYKNLRRIIKN